MALESHQEMCLCLAGTVALPSPIPEIGTISFQKDAGSLGDIVTVKLHVSATRSVKWTVRASDIHAYSRNPALDPEESKDGNWFFGDDARAYLQESSAKVKGSIHVKEDAQILLQIEMGLSAAEGVQAPLNATAHLGCCPHND